MGCEGCVATVDAALREVPGVRRVTVDRAQGTAEVELGSPVDTASLVAAIERAGYDAMLS